MDFNFFEDKDYHRFYTLKDGRTNEQYRDLDYLDLYFIELRKYKGKLQNLKTMLERWTTFLNNAHKYDHKNLPKELSEIKEIRKATQKLETMALDEQERCYYESQQKFLLDQNTLMQEAIAGKQLEIANNLILMGLDDTNIAKATGLTVGQIEELRHEKE